MASTTFVNYQTVIDAGWLNDVNSAVYSGTFQASTITPTNVTSSGAISGATVAGTTSVTTPIVKSGTSLSLQTNGSTTAVTIDTSQNLLVGTTSAAGSASTFYKANPENTRVLSLSGQDQGCAAFYVCSSGGENAAATAMNIKKNSSTSRSINAAGTVNAAGLDYAEYMIKSSNFTINKGDICGIDVNGKLTNVFANAISFVVKSTNPSYVGGDTWGSVEKLGFTTPEVPVRSENESDADWETAQANYKTALNAFESELATAIETARVLVDRIAFSGQVPVNVTGASAGQYIVPVAKQDGSIGGEAVSESAMTLQQYMQSVGKVISVVNNVTTIIVKVA